VKIYNFILFGILILYANLSYSQEQIINDIQDTSQVSSQSTAKRNTFKEIFSGKPGRAALYSLVLPGAGQIYNKKWLKLPLTYAIEGGAAYWLITNRQEFKKYDKIFDDLLNDIQTNNLGYTEASQVRPIRAKYRKQTEYAWVIMLLAHLYNTFDAYVDRHLLDFDISEDISFKQLPPDVNANYGSIGLVYQF
jgi:hypothetical protein